MTARQSLISLCLGASVYGVALAASAQVMLDNDSAAFFRYTPQATSAPARVVAAQPKIGDVSVDGLYTYVGGERGWINRQHSYDFVNGQVVHSSDCLPYAQPAPVRGSAVFQAQGPFADHGV